MRLLFLFYFTCFWLFFVNLKNKLAKTDPSVLLKIPRGQIRVNIKIVHQSLRYHDGYVRKKPLLQSKWALFQSSSPLFQLVHCQMYWDKLSTSWILKNHIQVLRHLFKFSIKLQIRQFHVVVVEWRQRNVQKVWCTRKVVVLLTKAIFTLCQIAFAPPQKSYRIGLLFTDKDGGFGAISVTERSLADLESVASHMGEVLCHTLEECEYLFDPSQK